MQQPEKSIDGEDRYDEQMIHDRQSRRAYSALLRRKSAAVVNTLGEDEAFADWAAVQRTANLLMQKDKQIVNPLWIFQFMWAMLVVLAIVNTGISCFYADVLAKVSEWDNSDWQGCLVFHDDHIIHTETTENLEKRLNFAGAMLARGPNSNMYTIAGTVATFASLGPFNMYDLLPTAFVTTWANAIAAVLFQNIGLIIPSITSLQATLITLRHYVRPSMFNHLEDSRAGVPGVSPAVASVDCTKAWQVSETAIIFNIAILAILLFFCLMTAFAELRRRKYLRILLAERAQRGYAPIPSVKGAWTMTYLVIFAWCGWVSQLVAKQEMAMHLMKGIQDLVDINGYEPLADYLPFSSGQMDLNSLLLIAMSMIATFAISHREPLAFGPIAVMGTVFISLFYPSVVVAWSTIATNKLQYHDKCKNYFKTAAYGDPNDHTAEVYCRDLWTSFISTLLVLVCVHGMVCTVIYIQMANAKETAEDVFYKTVLGVPDIDAVLKHEPEAIERLQMRSSAPINVRQSSWLHGHADQPRIAHSASARLGVSFPLDEEDKQKGNQQDNAEPLLGASAPVATAPMAKGDLSSMF